MSSLSCFQKTLFAFYSVLVYLGTYSGTFTFSGFTSALVCLLVAPHLFLGIFSLCIVASTLELMLDLWGFFFLSQRDHLKIAQQFFQLVGESASECGMFEMFSPLCNPSYNINIYTIVSLSNC